MSDPPLAAPTQGKSTVDNTTNPSVTTTAGSVSGSASPPPTTSAATSASTKKKKNKKKKKTAASTSAAASDALESDVGSPVDTPGSMTPASVATPLEHENDKVETLAEMPSVQPSASQPRAPIAGLDPSEEQPDFGAHSTLSDASHQPVPGVPAPMPPHASSLFADDAEMAGFEFGTEPTNEWEVSNPANPNHAAPYESATLRAGPKETAAEAADPIAEGDFERAAYDSTAMLEADLDAAGAKHEAEEIIRDAKETCKDTHPSGNFTDDNHSEIARQSSGKVGQVETDKARGALDEPTESYHSQPTLFTDEAEAIAFEMPTQEQIMEGEGTPDDSKALSKPMSHTAAALFADEAETEAFSIGWGDVETENQPETETLSQPPTSASEEIERRFDEPAEASKSVEASEAAEPYHPQPALFTDEAEAIAFDIPTQEQIMEGEGTPDDVKALAKPMSHTAAALFADEAETEAFDIGWGDVETENTESSAPKDPSGTGTNAKDAPIDPKPTPAAAPLAAQALFADDDDSDAFDIPAQEDKDTAGASATSPPANAPSTSKPTTAAPMNAASLFADDDNDAFDIGVPEPETQPEPKPEAAAKQSSEASRDAKSSHAAREKAAMSLFTNHDFYDDFTLGRDDQGPISPALPTPGVPAEQLDFEVPEGWYDESGNFNWYTPEEKEAVRQTMLSDPAYAAQSENDNRREPESVKDSYAPPTFAAHQSATAANPYAPAPSDPYAPAPAAPANPYAPAPASSYTAPNAYAPASAYAPQTATSVNPYAPAPQVNPYTPAPAAQGYSTYQPAAPAALAQPSSTFTPGAPGYGAASAYTPAATSYAPAPAAYDPYKPTQVAGYGPAAATGYGTGSSQRPTSPKAKVEPPKRSKATAYDAPFLGRLPKSRSTSYTSPAPAQSFLPAPDAPPVPGLPSSAPPGPPPGPPKRTKTSERVPEASAPAPRAQSTAPSMESYAPSPYDPPVPSMSPAVGYSATGYTEPRAESPINPPPRPATTSGAHAKPTSFDPPLRPSSSRPPSRHAARPEFAAPPTMDTNLPPVPPIPAQYSAKSSPTTYAPPSGIESAFSPPPAPPKAFSPPPPKAFSPPPPPPKAFSPPPKATPRAPSRGPSPTPPARASSISPHPRSITPGAPPRVSSPLRNETTISLGQAARSLESPLNEIDPEDQGDSGVQHESAPKETQHAPPRQPSPYAPPPRKESTGNESPYAAPPRQPSPYAPPPRKESAGHESHAPPSHRASVGQSPYAPPHKASTASTHSPYAPQPSESPYAAGASRPDSKEAGHDSYAARESYEPHAPKESDPYARQASESPYAPHETTHDSVPAQKEHSGYEPSPYAPPPKEHSGYEPAPFAPPPKESTGYEPAPFAPPPKEHSGYESAPLRSPPKPSQAAEDSYAPTSVSPKATTGYNPYAPPPTTTEYSPYSPPSQSTDYNAWTPGAPAKAPANEPPKAEVNPYAPSSPQKRAAPGPADPYAPRHSGEYSRSSFETGHNRQSSAASGYQLHSATSAPEYNPYAPAQSEYNPYAPAQSEYSPYAPSQPSHSPQASMSSTMGQPRQPSITSTSSYAPSKPQPPSATDGFYSPANMYGANAGQRTVSPPQEFGSPGQNNYFHNMHLDATYIPQQVLEQRPVTEDPLGRCSAAARNVPLVKFGFGGYLVTGFPGTANDSAETPTYGYGSYRGLLSIRPVSDVVAASALSANETPFPGPLVFNPSIPKGVAGDKKRRENVIAYLGARAEEIERGLPYLKSSASRARREEEAKLAIVRILTALVEGDGRLFGTPKAEDAVRAALQPPATSPATAPTINGLGATSGPSGGRATTAQLAQLSSMIMAGDKRDAAQFAAQAGLWSHALVISSSVDPEFWREIVTRFAATELADSPHTAGLKAAYTVFAGLTPTNVDSLFQAAHITDDPSADQWREVIAAVVFNGKPTDLICLDDLGARFKKAGLYHASHVCALLSPNSPFSDLSPSSAERPVTLLENATDEDALIFAEIAEYARTLVPTPKGAEAPFPAMAQLLPYKLQRAWRAAELGNVEQAKAYCEAIETASEVPDKGKTPILRLAPHLAAGVEDLLERLTGEPSVSTSKSLRSVRKAKSSATLGSWIEGRLTKFIAGEEEEEKRPTLTVNKDASVGPFSHFSTISPSPVPSHHSHSQSDMNAASNAPSNAPSTSSLEPPTPYSTGFSGGGYQAWGDDDDAEATPHAGPTDGPAVPTLNVDEGEFINPMGNLSFGGFGGASAPPSSTDYAPSQYAPPTAKQEAFDDDEDDLGFGNAALSRGRTPKAEDPKPQDDYKPAPKAEPKADPKADAKDAKSPTKAEKGSWLGKWWGKKENIPDSGSPGGAGYTKANLGEKMSMVYDKELKRYVMKGQEAAPATPAAPPPPPRAQTASPATAPRGTPPAARANTTTPSVPPVPPLPSGLPPSRPPTSGPAPTPPTGTPVPRAGSGSGPPGRTPGQATPSLDDLLSRPASQRPASAAAKKKRAANKYVDVFQG